MFTWLAILCCHLVCGAGETKSTCKSDAGKKRPKKKRLGHQMMHGKAIWKSDISYLSLHLWACQGFTPEIGYTN